MSAQSADEMARRREERRYLLCVDDIHNHTALQHASKTSLDGEAGNGIAVGLGVAVGGTVAVLDGKIVCHYGDGMRRVD